MERVEGTFQLSNRNQKSQATRREPDWGGEEGGQAVGSMTVSGPDLNAGRFTSCPRGPLGTPKPPRSRLGGVHRQRSATRQSRTGLQATSKPRVPFIAPAGSMAKGNRPKGALEELRSGGEALGSWLLRHPRERSHPESP